MYKVIKLLSLFSLILVFTNPKISSAKTFYDNKPSAEKQRFCESLVRKFGRESYLINDNWYGKGVDRPRTSKWHLTNVKKPGFFSSELFYVYEQKTKDGFTHTAYCKWEDDGYLEMFVEQFEYGGVVMCYSFADDDMKC